jgi:hypothetical protein
MRIERRRQNGLHEPVSAGHQRILTISEFVSEIRDVELPDRVFAGPIVFGWSPVRGEILGRIRCDRQATLATNNETVVVDRDVDTGACVLVAPRGDLD